MQVGDRLTGCDGVRRMSAGRQRMGREGATSWTLARVRGAGIMLALAVLLATPAAAQQTQRPANLRTFSQQKDDVTVRVAVPDTAQNQRTFGVPVDSKGVQPIWIEIENGGTDELTYLPIATDPEYYSPLEVSWRFRDRLTPEADTARDTRFLTSQIPFKIAPGSTVSGYVFTHRETGLKFVSVEIIRDQADETFHFIVPVSGPEFAIEHVDLDRIYPAEALHAVDLNGLRQALAALPCCGSDAEGTRKADPLNIVIVADGLSAAFPFVGRGWRFVQPLDLRTAAGSAAALLFDAQDPNLPVSPMWVFGRREDVALQKPRDTISQRNHLRLWLTPLRYQGQSVFVGQISRDIGVEFTDKSWYLTTHKIDPDVDFDRDYLLQDLLLSGAVLQFGYVGGVGASMPADPRVNLVGDPYITDGLRLVVLLGPAKSRFLPLEELDWDPPPRASADN